MHFDQINFFLLPQLFQDSLPHYFPYAATTAIDCLCGTESVFIQAVVPARSTMLREDGPTPRNIYTAQITLDRVFKKTSKEVAA